MSQPVTVFDVDLAPDGVQLEADRPAVVHRFAQGPNGVPEAVLAAALDEASLRWAGRFEPADFEGRWALLSHSLSRQPDLPHWLVFDTPFFEVLPDVARHTALPAELAEQHGIYRRGRHGPVHRRLAGDGRCVTVVAAETISVAALLDGQPLECTCGLTRLEGVPSEHTVGDIDPAAILYLVEPLGLSLDQVDQALTSGGGLAAVRADDGGPAMAEELLVHRLRRAIGAAAAVLDGLDSLVLAGPLLADLAPRLGQKLAYLGLGSSAQLVTSDLGPLAAAALAVADAGAY